MPELIMVTTIKKPTIIDIKYFSHKDPDVYDTDRPVHGMTE